MSATLPGALGVSSQGTLTRAYDKGPCAPGLSFMHERTENGVSEKGGHLLRATWLVGGEAS